MNVLDTKSIIVIGAGIGGLTTAAHLAQQGLNVLVIEKTHELAGAAINLNAKGILLMLDQRFL